MDHRYREDAAKNNTGRIKNRNIKGNVLDAYINHENPDMFVVTAHEKYISYQPVTDRTTAFYMRPLQLSGNPPWQKAIWFSRQAVGRQKPAGGALGCTRYMLESGVCWKTNKFISTGDSCHDDV